MKKIAALMGALGAWFCLNTAHADIASDYAMVEQTWAAKISPDGAHVAVGCSPKGARAVCVYPVDGNGKPHLFMLQEDRHINSFFWGSDNHVVISVEFFERSATSSGMQEYNVSRLLSYNLKSRKTVNLLKAEYGSIDPSNVESICDSDSEHIFIQPTYGMWHTIVTGSRAPVIIGGGSPLYRVNLSSGKMKDRDSSSMGTRSSLLDRNCEPVVAEKYDAFKKRYSIELIDGRRVLFEKNGFVTKPASLAGLTEGGAGLLFHTDDGLREADFETSQVKPVVVDGHQIGQARVVVDPFSNEVVGYGFNDDLARDVYLKKSFAKAQSMLEGALVGKAVRIVSWTRDYSMLTISAESTGEPAEFFLFEATDGSVSPLGSEMPQFEGKLQGKVLTVSYAARDGRQIEGFLTLPHGKSREEGPFRVIVMPHGGPETRDDASFDWWTQAYAASGYATFQPNFRGSAGYGREHLEAGFGEFGGKMVNDVVDGIDWLKSNGLLAGGRVCVAGASYGGYSALMTGLKAPEKVSCIISVNGVTDVLNLMSQYGRKSNSFQYWERYTGVGVFAEDGVQKDITPAARTGDFKSPVLIMQGREDTTVDIVQARIFKNAWGDRPGLTYVEWDSADHYLRTSEIRHDLLKQSLRFFEEHYPVE